MMLTFRHKLNKKVPVSLPKVQILRHQRDFSLSHLLVFALVFAAAGGYVITSSFAAKPPPPPPPPTYTPMAVTMSNYWEWPAWQKQDQCFSTDSQYYWEADGSLNPGESFTFTPPTPNCTLTVPDSPGEFSYGEDQYMSAQATWSGSTTLKITSTALPWNLYTASSDNPTITSYAVGNAAHLCGFPLGDLSTMQPNPNDPSEENITYHVTVTNIGSATANSIKFDGANADIWETYYYRKCMNADADRDGFNDSQEAVISGGYLYQNNNNPVRLRGYPPDFNNDGVVDQTDVAELQACLGAGNGVPYEANSPNGNINNGYPTWMTTPPPKVSPPPGCQIAAAADLDQDGYVDNNDLNIEKQLLGPDPTSPVTSDNIAPTARVVWPLSGSSVTRGATIFIYGYAWDNLALSKVEFYVNGSLQSACTMNEQDLTNWDPLSQYYYINANGGDPLDDCTWKVPKKAGVYSLTMKAYDNSGHSATSPALNLTAN